MKNLRWTLCLLVAALLVLPLVACSSDEPDEMAEDEMEEPMDEPMDEPMMAMTGAASLAGAAGSNVSGNVSFQEDNGALTVTASVTGAPPGEHGLHIHANGICEGDFTSAGGHFNPANTDHACPPATPRHAGDLGNITIGADGSGTLTVTVRNATLAEAANSVVGKAMILHAGTDDCQTQPTGDAGSRLACGVIATDGAMAGDDAY